MQRCVKIATPSVPYFRSFTAPKPTRTNWPLHFYIYRLQRFCFTNIAPEVGGSMFIRNVCIHVQDHCLGDRLKYLNIKTTRWFTRGGPEFIIMNQALIGRYVGYRRCWNLSPRTRLRDRPTRRPIFQNVEASLAGGTAAVCRNVRDQAGSHRVSYGKCTVWSSFVVVVKFWATLEWITLYFFWLHCLLVTCDFLRFFFPLTVLLSEQETKGSAKGTQGPNGFWGYLHAILCLHKSFISRSFSPHSLV
jgi:hypothetical protein